MKIVQTCGNTVEAPKFPRDLPLGTVFKLKGLSPSPTYLKLSHGYANLSCNLYTPLLSEYAVDLVYPNARLVLE
jgi:hypothetical protein